MLIQLNDKTNAYVTTEANMIKINFINKHQVIFLAKSIVITIDLLNKLNGLV